ncbi:uncharacterized protein YutD [Weissella uvarum]|uniref:YutD family protein n=1 Tax=Weissella uvarum TaxID=1479233 RepID=UPI0019605821|nr:YutD family protein [Weissella uvarum]MBM7616523.1 uncharacterized protein YutD [Weissella uvarum]MCM0595016.1 YutD family protein [Weissella uvarum]
MNRERMKELADSQFAERQAATTIVHTDEPNRLNINGRGYELVKNYREAFDEEMLAARFSEFLEKYDYIVGDIASNQLRLRGFYAQGAPGIARNQQINALQDYLYEDINFGAPYFVLQNLEPHQVDDQDEEAKPKKSRRRHRNHGKKDTGRAEIDEKKVTPKTNKPKGGKRSEVKAKGGQKNRRFEVRERQDTKD